MSLVEQINYKLEAVGKCTRLGTSFNGVYMCARNCLYVPGMDRFFSSFRKPSLLVSSSRKLADRSRFLLRLTHGGSTIAQFVQADATLAHLPMINFSTFSPLQGQLFLSTRLTWFLSAFFPFSPHHYCFNSALYFITHYSCHVIARSHLFLIYLIGTSDILTSEV